MKKPRLETMAIPMEWANAETGDGRTLKGYASVFNVPIESGEQTTFVKPGAFTKTLKENRDQIKVLFNHGRDPSIGEKPLGTILDLRQDKKGLYAEVRVSDTSYGKDVIELVRDGALDAMSIQFETTQEKFNDDLSERYLEQVRLYEFGPVTFPANSEALFTLHSREAHWDGAAALKTCSNAAEFRKIAFERNNDSDPDTAAHWALPHHPSPGAGADSTGVAAALAALHGGRGGAPNLKQSVATVEAHLQAHQAESSDVGDRDTEGDDTPPAVASLALARLTWERDAVTVELAERMERLGIEHA